MLFLERIAEKYLAEYGNDIYKVTFVFPTRRAGLFFLRHLQKKNKPGTAIWAPNVYSIHDFIAAVAGVTIPDQLDLIFALYGIYKKHIRHYPKEFEDFYAWGKMIIGDFDEIDKNMVDTEALFRALKNFKALEDKDIEEKPEIYKKYTGFWEDLGVLHREFKVKLNMQNRAYDGMVYREVAENIAEYTKGRSLPGLKTVFCGFNALTKAEEVIIKYLLKEERAEIYWDIDLYFMEDRNQEAGHFARKNMTALEIAQPLWMDAHLALEKNITIVGVQSKVSQAKVLGMKLQQLQQEDLDPEKIAVVLPDETLLFPTLNSLPENIGKVNVSIGYPLQQTPVFSLLNTIIEMQLRIIDRGGLKDKEMQGFYYKDIRQVLNHPYIKPFAPDEIMEFIDGIRKNNRIYFMEEEFTFPAEIVNGIFKLRIDSQSLLEFFIELLDVIRLFYSENKPDITSVDYEYIYHFYTLLSRLKESLQDTHLVLNINTFRQLFTDIVMSSHIPFTGEPLEGLQILGMLETQTLDFDNIYILSVNEGKIPPGKAHQSFIPNDVRLSINLPTYKDRDAIAAYHFYRLLKSARNLHLIYTTDARGVEKSEKSRFIDQVLIEYGERNPKANIVHQIIDFSFGSPGKKPIEVNKTAHVLDKLYNKNYSASALLSYLTCPLKFYLTYILRLFEEDDVFESPDYRIIGDIVHEALHQLYLPYLNNKPVGMAEIGVIKENLEVELKKAYFEILKTNNIETGRNRIVYDVMKRLLEGFFEKEGYNSGFKITMLEREIKRVYIKVSMGEVE
ncbi:MAG: hypothetical protein GY757_59220, partial [bacterium]|nr:hypothetical protein [bacterium]